MLCLKMQQYNNEFIGAAISVYRYCMVCFIADISVIEILLIGAPLIYTSDNNIH